MKKSMRITLPGTTLMLLGLQVAGLEVAQAVPASTYTVTTANDDAGNVVACTGTAPTFSCATLRDAITQANSDATSPTIIFSPSIAGSTIVLGGPLPIGSSSPGLNTTIDGTGESITISGAGQNQVMSIYSGTVTINALTIANGTCSGCSGGGIGVYLNKGPPVLSVTVNNSTFSGNSATNGGAIYSLFQLNVLNSTFYNNSAVAGGGGAIDFDGTNESGTLNVKNSTFSSNTASNGDTAQASGAIYLPDFATATLTNTILAAELPAGVPNPGNCLTAPNSATQQITDGGGNLSDDPNNTCGFVNTGPNATNSGYGVPDIGVEGLNLGSLASNGGPTQTIALLSNPASVAISSGLANCPSTDQRGVGRPATDCSSGAYQFASVQNGTGTAAGCTSPAICNITGGENQSIAAGTPAASAALAALMYPANVITENVCTVAMDPRKICPPGIPSSPYYNSATLPLAAMCPSLPSGGAGNSVVPDYLCGDYGPTGAGSGTGFAVIQGIANGVNGIPGLLIMNDANPDAFFPPGGNPASECTTNGAFIDNISNAWGPWSLSPVEGVVPEGNRIIELTDGCGGGKHTSGGMSMTVFGVTLNVANATQELGRLPKTLVNFAEYKYVNLGLEVAGDPIDRPNKVELLAILAQSALFLAAGKNGCAEDTLYEADRYVINNASHFHGAPALDPNSYGRTRSRILNLFFTLFTRIDGNVNPITDLGPNVGLPLLAPSLSGPPASCSVKYLGPDGY
jgi:hypothetical protein